MFGPDPGYYRRVRAWSETSRYQEEFLQLWRRMELPRGAAVLDVGSGAGRGLELLRAQGARPLGIDPGRGWEGFVRGPLALRAAAQALPFADRRFDGAILMHSLAHLADPVAALREIARVLRPGGPVGIVTPNARHLALLRLPGLGDPAWRPDPTVERHLGPRGLRAIIAAAGLGPRRLEAIGRAPLGLPVAGLRERLLAVAVRPDAAP